MIYLGGGKYRFFLDFNEIELTLCEINILIEKFIENDLVDALKDLEEENEDLEEKIELLEYSENELDEIILIKRKTLKELKNKITQSKKQLLSPEKTKRSYNKKNKIIKLVSDIKEQNTYFTNIEIFRKVAKKLNISIKAVDKAYYNKK